MNSNISNSSSSSRGNSSNEIRSGADVLPPRPKTAKEKAAEYAALTEEEKRQMTCCFTGHRPQKLLRPIDDIKVDLENEILAAINEGYRFFITGMAYGTDIWAGNIVARLKERFPELKLIAVIPFPNFSDNWCDEWKLRYERLISRADRIITLSKNYDDSVFQKRNMWMVDHSSKVIAVYNGAPSGTRNTIKYARSKRVNVKYLAG